MPTFNFTISKKKQTVKRQNVSIIDKNVVGVVFANIDGSYEVESNNTRYIINPKNYTCKGVSRVYRQDLVDKLQRCVYIRLQDNLQELNPLYYLPFTAGCCVIGDICVKEGTFIRYFNIRKVYTDIYNEISIKAMQFYREHYVEIRKNRDEYYLRHNG